MFTRHDRFKKKNNKNTYNYYDSGHDRSYGRTDEINLLTAPSFLSQFKPKHDGKRFRTTSQLEPDMYCDFVAEVCYFRADTVQNYDHRTGKQTGNKVTMILTDYTEHEELPHQNEEGRPIGKASIITTLWDEHYQAAVDKGIGKGDLLRLRNLRAKSDLTRKIELNMNGYRGFGYQQEFPITKLDPSDTDDEDENELLAPPWLVRIPGYPIGSFASLSTTRSPSQDIQPVVDTLSDLEFVFSSKKDDGDDNGVQEDDELEPIQELSTPSVFPDAIAATSTTRSSSQDIQPVGVDVPFVRQSIIVIDDENEENEVLLVPTPRRLLSAEEIASTTRSPSQDFRLLPDTPLERNSTPLERNPSLPVERESSGREFSIPVAPDFQCLRSPIPLINTSSTRPAKRETTPLVAVKLELNLEASSPTLSSVSALRRSNTTPFEVSPTVMLTGKAKGAKRSGLRVMPLCARVVGFEPKTLIDFSGLVCSKCEYKYPPRSKKVPALRCPSCKHDDGVEFKYDFKLKLMDEFGQDFIVKVDDTHACAHWDSCWGFGDGL
ncbi:hypothetical protein EC957_005059 [Mortierella hygrophila]|uniref:Protection of telomeres protein 1 ssDNA-binding domain-containing protein n=1 Tax=Mortierella hygrophila TaxID=979708 RepID=A0A9P6K064_9FUNG|nr:hypothetical protein EC957_005059 [Mortierella hygrophila]